MLRAAVISLESTSSQWIIRAMKKYFDEVDSLNVREIEVLANKDKVDIYCGGTPIKEYDVLYLRGSYKYAHLLQTISEILYEKTYLPIQPQSFVTVHDKFFTQMELAKNKIPTPTTYLAATTESAKKILKKVNYPIIIKFLKGTHGKGVMYAESYASASSILDAVESQQNPLIIQSYLETEGEDIRTIVVGDKVVAAMLRKSERMEKRANIHVGAQGKKYEINEKLERMAVKCAKVLGAEICAVDLLETSLGYYVIEANISLGLQGITTATDIDVADKIAKYLYEKAKIFKEEKKKTTTGKILKEIETKNDKKIKHFVTTVDLRGNRILLPDIVTKFSELDHGHDIVIKLDKGKVDIEKLPETEEEK